MSRRPRLLLGLGVVLVLGASGLWALGRGPQEGGPADTKTAAVSDAAASAHPRQREVLALSRDRSSSSQQKLVELYASLANDPSALGVRKLALGALFSEPSVGLRLKRVLDAVAADPTPARRDPLWPEITRRLAEHWSRDLFDKGRDLMLMEQRARARRALVASFVDLARSNEIVGEIPRNALLTDLIDLHNLVEPDQRADIREAVRAIGGNDPADLLGGKGLTAGDKLELQVEYERQLQAAMDSLVGDKR